MGGVGVATGLLAGFFGVGGGSVAVPAMSALTPMSHVVILGTSLAAMVPTAVSGTLSHARQGNVVWPVALPLALGSMLGASGAARAIRYVDDEPLAAVFAVVMIVMGARNFR